MEEKQPKQKKKAPEKRLFHKPITPKKIVIYCSLALLIAGMIFVGRFAYVTLINGRAAFEDSKPTPSPTPAETTITSTPTATLTPEEILAMQADRDFMKDRVNILLTGIDYAEEREGRNDFRTDTIMLFSVNFATGCVDILSVPRDSYADIAFTDRNWKINGAWMSAGGFDGQGFECLMQTVSTTIGGIPVNYYLAVEMQAVKDIVDIIGGVWYDVDYEITMNGRHLDKGYQLLDGQAVLDYCRARKGITSGTDIDRIDRQQRLLLEVFKQLKSSNLLPKIPEIYDAMKTQIYTNLNFEQIAALAFFSLDLDTDTELNRYSLTGEYTEAKSSSYYVLDHTYTCEVVNKIFGVEPQIDWSYDLKYVEYDTAARHLEEAIKKAKNYLSENQAVLSSELKETAQEQISSAQKACNSAKSLLKKAKKANSNDKIKGPEKLEKATKKMLALYDTLHSYVLNPPPAPAPKPAPSVSTEPLPTESIPAAPAEPTATESLPTDTTEPTDTISSAPAA